MTVATGVSYNSEHILPYLEGMKTVYYVSYRKNLSKKAKLKLHCYELYKYHHIKVSDISKTICIDRSTIYRWIKQTKMALQIRRYQYLEPKSSIPKHRPRDKVITPEYAQYILDIRDTYKCGKDKIHYYLKLDYDIKMSPSTIGRYLSRLPKTEDPRYMGVKKKSRLIKRTSPLIRPKDVIDKLEERAFERFQIDTKYWSGNGDMFYVITAVDTQTRMAYARAYRRHTANCARDFLRRLNYVFDISDSNAYIQRDNGTEFIAQFEQEANKFNITLITNYVRRPQMNTFVERFNRILKEECLDYNSYVDTVQEANGILKNFLIMYNFQRVHAGLEYNTPFERYLEMKFGKPVEYIEKHMHSLSQRLWTCTLPCKPCGFLVNFG